MKKVVSIFILGLLCFTACMNNTKPKETTEIVEVANEVVEERTGDELKIVAIMTVKPENAKKILSIFEALVEGSQQEDGCIYYNLHQDINDPTKFVMLEEWKSQAAIDFHNNTEHYKAFQEASKGLIEKSEVSILKLVY
ncbi:MAG: putative quinol monooxygenase [Dysgonomonas sp.]|nr:putative quinol monooxygenase [Dysgonomonas sp.]